ncbi:MAG: hypothetical protein MOB07_17310 [Acidobacteria bacterium]|nr:hypothetical protein [Acidobacteriota bacterium]
MLVAELGLQLPDAVAQSPAVISALGQMEGAAKSVGDAASAFEAAVGSRDEIKILASLVRIGAALREFYLGLDGLVVAVQGSVTPATVPDADERAAVAAFAQTLAKRVSDYALASAITEHMPDLGFALNLVGLFDWHYEERDAANPLSHGHVSKGLRFERVNGLINDPVRHLRETIGWGDAGFDPTHFFSLVREFFDEEAAIDIGVEAGEPFLKGCILLRRDSSVSPPGLTVVLIGEADSDTTTRTELNSEWGLSVESKFRMVGGVTGRLTPPLTLELKPLSGEITGELRSFADRNQDARPIGIIGGTGGLLTITANNVSAGVGLKAQWDISNRVAKINPLVFADIDGLILKIGSADADGFIAKLLSGAKIEGQFDLGLEWLADSGLRVKASGGVEIAVPIHTTLGPIELNTVYVALRILQDGTLSLEVSTALTGLLGPLTAVVDRIGAIVDFRFDEGTDGDFGPFDLDLRFKPPTAIGLSIDAGVVRGGGFLRIDSDRGEYAGNLELTFSEIISLKAIGLITTKMPDGSKGFSLLIIITAEFGSGIQLGFGFTLLGVGGLLGLNRTVQMQPLMEGIRTGAVESIMFPQDVITNAPKIISDLRIIFPPREGTFLIGPMAKLGWGTPTLISISLGIIIEIPGNIAILGILKIAIPADEIALIILQVNFAGAIEFDRKRLYFFAALFESRIVFLTIEGEMGLLVAFGDDANFLVSVGGFHPRFNPPPLPFPSPKRIAVSLLNTPVSRLRIEGYFAVTSNTVQFGARVDVFFGLDEVNVQGHLQFDALFQFSPFFFIIEISASLSVNVFGIGLFSVRIRGSLDGPAPYHIKGHGSIGFFFFDVDVDFEDTWGERRNTELPPIAVLSILQGEINKADNWRALLPASNNLLVSLRKMPTAEAALILHPLGVLEISQRALPLELKLDKVGTQKPSDVNRVSIAVTGGGLTQKDNAFAQFALAQYQNFSDSEKLSLPAFAHEKSGLKLSAAGAEVRSSQMVKRIVRYEEIIIDNNFKRFQRRFRGVFSTLFTMLLDGNAVSRAELSQSSKKRLQAFAEKIDVKSETYTVALQSNNTAFAADSISFHSEASARDYLNRKVAEDASLVDEIHVIPSFEMAA